MTTTIVLDASILVKRVLNEPDAGVVRAWFNAQEEARFVGPTLLFAETGRVLQKTLPGTAVGQLQELHSRLMGAITLFEPSEAIWQAADALTFYDAHYIHLAAQLGATLATADDRMKSAAKKRGIPLAKF